MHINYGLSTSQEARGFFYQRYDFRKEITSIKVVYRPMGTIDFEYDGYFLLS